MPLRENLFLCRFILILVPLSYGFDISKTFDKELKIAVHFKNVDGVDVGVEWDKTSLE